MYDDDRYFYEEKKDLHGAKKLGFNCSYTQSYRYGVLTKDLNLQGLKCLILGCGQGIGTQFLHIRGCNKIVGVDRIPRFIEKAKENYPEHEWLLVDGTCDAFQKIGLVDWVFVSGSFNVCLESTIQYQRLHELLEHSQYIKIGLAISMTTNVSKESEAFDWNPEIVLSILKNHFKKWKIDHSYFDNDFSIWGFK